MCWAAVPAGQAAAVSCPRHRGCSDGRRSLAVTQLLTWLRLGGFCFLLIGQIPSLYGLFYDYYLIFAFDRQRQHFRSSRQPNR